MGGNEGQTETATTECPCSFCGEACGHRSVEMEELRARVMYLEWSMEMAADNIERGRDYDALHGLRAPLGNGSYEDRP